MKYRPEIDGLRAIAVGAVVLFHATGSLMPGGFIGVDVFFVISGFLITTILLEDLRQDRFSLMRFYERRARRILPALTVVVVLTLLASCFLLPLHETNEAFESALATMLFLANVRFWLKTDYFATAAEEQPFLHMWSLAVEEQYYLFFPILLYFVWRWRKSALLWVLLCLTLLSLITAEVLSRHAPVANFFLPMGRVWELLVGSCIAYWGVQRPRMIIAEGATALGLLMIIIPIFMFSKATPTPSLWTAIPVVGTALVILYARDGSRVTRLLQLRPMIGLGLISYSVYLYHQPLLAFARVNLPGAWKSTPVFLGIALLAVILGYLSWRYVEKPFRRGFSRQRIFILSGVSIGLITTLSAVAVFAPQTLRNAYVSTLSDASRERFYQIESLSDVAFFGIDLPGECHFVMSYADDMFLERFQACEARYGPGILVIGGSHAADLHGALVAASDHPFIAGLALGFCRPYPRLSGPPPHECHYDGIRDFVRRHGDLVEHVIYTQVFFALFDDYAQVTSTRGFHPELAAMAADYLQSLAEHVPVSMMGPRRTLPIDPKRLDPRHDLFEQMEKAYVAGTSEAEDLADRTFATLLAGTPVDYLSVIELAQMQMPEDGFDGEILLYQDTNHWNAAGEIYFGARLRRAIMALETSPLKIALYGRP